MISSATSHCCAAHSCRSWRSRVGTFSVAKMKILSTCVPWVQMDLMSPSNFARSPSRWMVQRRTRRRWRRPAQGTRSRTAARRPGRSGRSRSRVPDPGRRHRPGGRYHVAGNAPLGHLAAQVLERVVLVVRGHAPQGEPDHLGRLDRIGHVHLALRFASGSPGPRGGPVVDTGPAPLGCPVVTERYQHVTLTASRVSRGASGRRSRGPRLAVLAEVSSA